MKTFSLTGKLAIVTGASRGIGEAIARKMAQSGARVILVARSQERLKTVAESIRQAGGQAWPVVADISREDQVIKMVEKITRDFHRIDILINNAGIGYALPVPETTASDWDLMMNTNARGAFFCSREVFKVMVEQKISGTIINIASLAGKKGYRYQAAYCASKFALIGFSKVLAMEGRDYGIRVHLICPGGVNTEFIRKIRPDIPPETLIQPEDIAETVLFLLHQSPSVVTDEILMRRFTSEVI
ncbi:MAG TPA: SDR family oxidoreductase [bacterium]|nr:SDR family oxidoreductase [bacterium]HOL68031.1 SDR family oxidoreductase [bacterium]HPP11286.1 SDR family oxidoreductase [bacterium]